MTPKPGDRLCVVEMNGCMGNVRGTERWGTILDVQDRTSYGAAGLVPMALLKRDDGSVGWEIAAGVLRVGKHFERHI